MSVAQEDNTIWERRELSTSPNKNLNFACIVHTRVCLYGLLCTIVVEGLQGELGARRVENAENKEDVEGVSSVLADLCTPLIDYNPMHSVNWAPLSAHNLDSCINLSSVSLCEEQCLLLCLLP